MRPNLASSWNISRIGPWPAQSARAWASRSGIFFPLLLSQRVALRVALVGCELAPAVAVQQVVDRGQRHRAPESGFDLGLDLADDQNASGAGALQERRKQLALLLGGHVLAAAATTRLALAVTDNLTGQEAVAQPARPWHRATNRARRLLQAQPIVQRQHDRLRLAQLLDRLRPCQHFARPLQVVCTPRSSRHVHLPWEFSTWLLFIY